MNSVAALLILIQASGAAPACAAREAVIENLANRYGERLTVGGLQEIRGRASVLEIWTSDETGTFTVLLTQPNGISCIVAAGTNFSISNANTPRGETDG